MKKIKYILKKLLIIFLIAFISIILYQFFMEIKKGPQSKDNNKDISMIIKRVSSGVVGISKIKNTGSSAFLSNGE